MTTEYSIAEKNFLRQHLLSNFLDPLTLKGLQNISLKDKDRVLDLGCGIGDTTILLARQFPGIIITGVDADHTLIAHARSCHQSSTTFMNFVTADATCLPFENDQFDFVFSRFMVHHIAAAETVFKEIKRVCKPGGIVFMQEPDINFIDAWPANTAYPKLNEVVNALFADAKMGRKLLQYFKWIGLKNISHDARILLATGNHVLKQFYSMTAAAMETAILDKRLMTRAEMDIWIKELLRIEKDPETTVITHPIISVWGTK